MFRYDAFQFALTSSSLFIIALTGRNISRGKGVVHWDLPCKKLDVPSTQKHSFILSSVWMKEILNLLMLGLILDREQQASKQQIDISVI